MIRLHKIYLNEANELNKQTTEVAVDKICKNSVGKNTVQFLNQKFLNTGDQMQEMRKEIQ